MKIFDPDGQIGFCGDEFKFRKEVLKKFNGEAALLFRACFHIEGDWRPFEDGILWEMRGLPRPLKLN